MFNLIITIMKKGIFKSIGKGILNGFPLIQSIVKNVKGVKENNTVGDGTTPPEKKSFDIVSIITEAAIVVLIVAFATGKISIESLERLIGLIK